MRDLPGWPDLHGRRDHVGLACADPITVSVSLDMGCSNLEPIPEVMAIVGSFNGWCGDCDPLYPIGGGLYDGTISMVEEETQYRFVGLDYAIDEKGALWDEVSSGQGDWCRAERERPREHRALIHRQR